MAAGALPLLGAALLVTACGVDDRHLGSGADSGDSRESGGGDGRNELLADSPIDQGNPVDAKSNDAQGDSASADAPGTILWARSASSVFLYGVAEGSTGVVITGSITAPADLGGLQALVPRGKTDTVIAQFATTDAAHQYSTQFGGGGEVYGFLDTVDPKARL